MSEFKGTPGPWSAGEDEESMATSIITAGNGDILCVVGTFMTSTEEDLANAELIASAPDLLEACLRARNQFYAAGYEPKAGSMNPTECLLAQLIAAISKATGE